MPYPGPPRRAAGLARYLLLAILVIFILGYLRQYHASTAVGDSSQYLPSLDTQPPPTPDAPAAAPVNPGTKDSQANAPQVQKPETKGPEPETPKPQAPEPKVPEPEKPKPEELKPEAPATKAPELEKPKLEAPETKVPELEKPKPEAPATSSTHPIDELIVGAEKSFEELLKKESKDLKSAAAEYRKRRGRHPPPGFDTWFKFAQNNSAIIVEDFFDQIHHDLGPFWGLPASTMRKEAWDYEMTIHVRGHNATAGSDWFWTKIWLNLTKTIEHMLPDISLPLNAMDEPRIVAPWEQVNEYMEIERSTRSIPPASEVISEFQKLENPGNGPDKDVETRPKEWEDTRKSTQPALCPDSDFSRSLLESSIQGLSPG